MNQFKKTTKQREKRRGIYFQLGLIIAGGLTLVAFEWTTPTTLPPLPPDCTIDDIEIDYPIIMPEVKIDKPEVKPIEAPKKSVIIKAVDVLFELDPNPNPDPEPELDFNPDDYKVIEKIPVEPKIYTIPEVMPEFEGGMKAMFKYLGSNLKYPKREKSAGIEGTVYLEFVVGRKGQIKNIKVLRGVNEAIDNEAIRVLKAMPNWKPGKQHGKAVNVKYNLPIKFMLN